MKKLVTLEQDDIDCLHDVIKEALNFEDLSNERVLEYWNKLPDDLKDEAIHWGLDDTVVGDNIYEWLIEHSYPG
jgi:hypothetical protein